MPQETFFQYLDETGAVVLVDRLEKVPEAFRARAREIELPAEEAAALQGALATLDRLSEQVGGGVAGLRGQALAMARDQDVEPLSFGLGFLAAMLLGVGFWVVRGGLRIAFKLALLVALAALFGGLYFGYVRQSAGLSEGLWSDPGQLLEDAEEARDRLDARQKSAEKELKEGPE